jgi:hypothetical protein
VVGQNYFERDYLGMEYHATWYQMPPICFKGDGLPYEECWTPLAHIWLRDNSDNTIDEQTYLPFKISETTHTSWDTVYYQTKEEADKSIGELVIPHIIKKWGEEYGITKEKIKKN